MANDAPCGVCRGTGSVLASRVASEPPEPPPTLDDAMRQIRQLQRAVLLLVQPDPQLTLAAKRAIAKMLQEQLEKDEGAT